MMVLGLSFGFHDAAAALLLDGEVVAAVEEERLTRKKHDAGFPDRAIDCCLAIAGAEASDVDLVAFHEKPIDVLDRNLRTRLRAGPAGWRTLLFDTPGVVKEQLTVPHQIDRWFRRRGALAPAIEYIEHHTSHAAAAFYPSPFESAAVLTVDGVGEHATSSIGEGRGRRLAVDRELRFPSSVGLLYSAFTQYCGMRVNSGEGELMGLAPFGEPQFADRIREHLVEIGHDGSIRLDLGYFDFLRGRRMVNRRFEALFGGPSLPLGQPPTQREADLAASIQLVLEDIVLAMAGHAHELTGHDSLCLGGGVALNCVANGRILRDGPFENLWVQPAAGDAGSALGAAWYAWHELGQRPRPEQPGDRMQGAFLGPSFEPEEIASWLAAEGIEHRRVPSDGERCAQVARRLAAGDVVGWFTGRMEFGPRALGHRSILADPRSATVQGRINGLVKERAAFRPFAPAVLADHVGDWFDDDVVAPYMNVVTSVRSERRVAVPEAASSLTERVAQVRSEIPAVTHVDGSARIQTVDAGRNPAFARLLGAFFDVTGCPILLNTSFNTRDEPVVCTPADAHATFCRAGLDLLVLEDCLVERAS